MGLCIAVPLVKSFVHKGILYIPEEPIPQYVSYFKKGLKDFQNGWKHEGDFDYEGEFVSGKITCSNGVVVQGTVSTDVVYGEPRTYHNDQGQIQTYKPHAISRIITSGKITFANGKTYDFDLQPFTYLNQYDSKYQVFYLGIMGSYQGIFTEDSTNHIPIRFITLNTRSNKLYVRQDYTFAYLSVLLGMERHMRNGTLEYEVKQHSHLSNENFIILHSIVNTLPR